LVRTVAAIMLPSARSMRSSTMLGTSSRLWTKRRRRAAARLRSPAGSMAGREAAQQQRGLRRMARERVDRRAPARATPI
jgi:hypothetical protein